jgi:hypothetical protein
MDVIISFGVVVIGLLGAAAMGFLSLPSPPEFNAVRVCIGLMAAAGAGIGVLWFIKTEWSFLPRATLAALLGALILAGTAEAWRIIDRREVQTVTRQAMIKGKLHQLFVEIGPLIDRQMPKDIPPDEFQKYMDDVQAWVNKSANWIRQNMGEAARAKFLDRTGMMGMSYSLAVNPQHNTIIQNLSRFRQNVNDLIQSNAWEAVPADKSRQTTGQTN